MSATLPSNENCCRPSCDDNCPPQVPGPPGKSAYQIALENGFVGTEAEWLASLDGAAGINATTLTTASFIQPAVDSTVSVEVVVSSWVSNGQIVFVQGGGDYMVDSVPDSTHMVLKNLGYPNNSVPTTVVPTDSSVSASGQRGEQGADGTTVTLNDISPTTTKGDILVDNGANNPDASVVRFAAGANGTVIVSDSTQPTGKRNATITPNAMSDMVIPRYDASGSTTPTPLQSSGLLINDDGAIQGVTGDARGTKAVDLQVQRAVADQVALGDYSTISGGKNNKAGGENSVIGGGSTNRTLGDNTTVGGGTGNQSTVAGATVCGGNTNLASGTNATVAGGFENTASAQDSHVGGGSGNAASATGSSVSGGAQNTASGLYSNVSGGNQSVSDKYGQDSFASGSFSSPGDCQWSRLICRNSTTDDTPTRLYLDGSAAELSIPNDTAWAVSGFVLGVDSGGVSASWAISALIKNISGTTSVVGSPASTSLFSDGGFPGGASVTVTADDGADALAITVVGGIGASIKWASVIEFTQIRF